MKIKPWLMMVVVGLCVTRLHAQSPVCVSLASESAWTALRCEAQYGETLRARHAQAQDGFLFPAAAKQRRTLTFSAQVKLEKRLLDAKGWNLAGIALYADDDNFWMLALQEGPDGRRSIDFIEKCHGVWQAQNEKATYLPRQGSVATAWADTATYGLTLTVEPARIVARVADEAGKVLSQASFEIPRTIAAVRCGRPALFLRGSQATFQRVQYTFPVLNTSAGVTFEDGPRGRVALYLPQQTEARTSTETIADRLRSAGLGVTLLDQEALVREGVLDAGAVGVAILPQCERLPVAAGEMVEHYLKQGGHVAFLGGPFLSQPLVPFGNRWLDKQDVQQVKNRIATRFRPFELNATYAVATWQRACMDKRVTSALRVVPEGPNKDFALCLDLGKTEGWDVFHSPSSARIFGSDDDVIVFSARTTEPAGALAVEVSERDGSRWIASVSLTSAWKRIVLSAADFRYWPDSKSKGRGHAGDQLNPEQVVRIGFGVSNSHTPSMMGRVQKIWVADLGSARNPFVQQQSRATCGEWETIYPAFKTHTLTGRLDLVADDVPGRQSLTGAVVCAIPRPLGAGIDRNPVYRFIPLARVSDAQDRSGISEWLLLNQRGAADGSVCLGLGYRDPRLWCQPDVLNRLVKQVLRLTSGSCLDEAGAQHFAYWPDEPVTLGARVRTWGKKEGGRISFEVLENQRTVWRQDVQAAPYRVTWKPAVTPQHYTVRTRLLDAEGTVIDQIEHTLFVLDPAPAPRSDFLTVRNGNFWYKEKKWYAVGVNYWPLYVSSMPVSDYNEGWLRNRFYAPEWVEQDIRQMRDMSINLVSIQIPPVAEYRNLLHFLQLCKLAGIWVNIFMPSASPLAFNKEALATYLSEARLPGNATVFAYDTIWEPGNHVFKDSAARSRWDSDWRAWIDAQYGSLARAEAEWGCKARRSPAGVVISPDDRCFREDGPWRIMMAAYRRFMDNLTSRLWGEANRTLRQLDPNHLISFRQGNTLPYDFALSGPVKHIDFICPEGYSIRDTDEGEDAIGFITRFVDFTTAGKPILWAEFGISVWNSETMTADPRTIERQGSYSERFYRTGLEAGAQGTIPWWWPGGYRINELSDFGIIEQNREERPAAKLIRTYGPRIMAARAKPAAQAWMTLERDAHAGGYWWAAFNSGAEAYRQAKTNKQMLGIRTAGSGTTSLDTPLIAVGGKPCTGTNPPRYLDAEFNTVSAATTRGEQPVARNGVVAAERAAFTFSVGNVQEATWATAAQAKEAAGAVELVVRSEQGEIARLPLKQATPYLQDALFGPVELALPRGMQSLTVRVRLEARKRTPFGETFVFTLKQP